MNRREFFKASGGAVIAASLLDFGAKQTPQATTSEIRPSDCSQLVVTAQMDDGTTYTWVIDHPQKGMIPGPMMTKSGTITDLSFYGYPHEYLGKIALGPRYVNAGDTISLELS